MSSTNYYEFKDAKVVICNELRKRNWNIFGWHDDESDPYTDYYNPEYWSGVAEKNGYVCVIDCSSRYSGKIDYHARHSRTSEVVLSERDQRLVKALREITQERGASAEEERSALEKIDIIFNKRNTNKEEKKDVYFPAFQDNPGRCSWHVEKDGKIIVKGTGIAKFYQLYHKNRQTYADRLNDAATSDYRREEAEMIMDLFDKLNKLINRIDAAAGCTIGNDEYNYRTVTETKYKHQNVAVERESGTIEEGTTFIVKGWLGYNRSRGKVYRMHKHDGYFSATCLNRSLTKERTGKTTGIEFGYGSAEQYQKYFDRGIIAFCDIKDEATPYEVEKVIKSKKKTA